MMPNLLRVFQTLDASAYSGDYNWTLVVVSVAIAILAAFTALSIADRVAVTATPRGRAAWISAGALSMGGGIWAMHFIGMIAFSLPCGVKYDPIETLLSMAPGVAASGVALSIIARPKSGPWRLALGAVLMGGGIGAMHYAGMGAMRPEALLRFDPFMVGLSVLVAVALAFAALDIRSRLSRFGLARRHKTLVAAVVMGCAIPGMHYTAMQAAVFYPLPGSVPGAVAPQTMLALTVAGFGFLVAISALAAAFAGEQREIASRLKKEVIQRKALEQESRDGRARLEAIFDAVVDAIVTSDAQGRIRQWSSGAERIFGYTADEVIGENFSMLLASSHDASPAVVAEFLQAPEPDLGRGRELTALRKGGAEFPIELAISEVDTQEERLFTGIMRDITERKAAEQELIVARVQAEEANAAKSQFLATMSHEIRTPINGVLGMASLLSTTPLSEQQGRLLGNLSRSGQALLGIINDVLDFSKIEAGKLDLTSVEFDPREILAEVADLFAERCSAKGLELVYHVSEETPARVRCDSARLRQVLTNIVGNALKFTEQGEVLIRLSTTEAGDAAVLSFAVEDTGIGIEADKLHRVFNSFEQVDHSMRRARGGTGLGLAISRQLVEMMGGAIGVESEFGRGSRFFFTVRCDVVEVGEADRANRRVEPPLTLLLVDSHKVSAQVMTEYLERWMLDATVVSNLAQARRAMTRGKFDAVILDVKGLGAPAIALGAEIAAAGPVAPAVIFLIGMDRLMADERLEAAGAFAVLSKPVRPSELFECLTAVATRPAAGGVARFFVKRAAAQSMGRFNARLLVAEDNPVNQEVATGMLEAMGCEVVVAPNGRIAAQLCGDERFDLVLMDCEMPQMDGLEATRLIRSRESDRHCPIIALTAHALADIHQACLDAGMDDFLTKPFDERRINDALRRWIPQCETHEAPAVEPAPSAVPEGGAIDHAAFDNIAAFRGPNGPALMKRVVGKFQEAGPALTGVMCDSAGEGNIEALWHAAHSLKSSAAAVGAARLSDRCAQIEALGRAGDLEGIKPLLGGLEPDLAAALSGLAELVEARDAQAA